MGILGMMLVGINRPYPSQTAVPERVAILNKARSTLAFSLHQQFSLVQ